MKIGRRLAVSNNVMAVVPAAIGLIACAVAVVAAWVLIGDALGLRGAGADGIDWVKLIVAQELVEPEGAADAATAAESALKSAIAIGYYDPGHYCFLVVDGRQKNTRGMFLEEMSSLFEQLGCCVAYNLDGGHCSFMTLGAQVANHPYKKDHGVADGIFICESPASSQAKGE
ncbi:MAG TPA: phosphodiester glycosidase family protein [Candidatus Aphodovivens excrementavium]|nr:phosphodiester glycosidase family protein [Candidatus Aphodovivens excrementavium]